MCPNTFARTLEVPLLIYTLWLVGCRFKSNCPLVGPGTIDDISSVVVFLGDRNSYLREFRRKLRTTMSTNATENRTGHLPSITFERKTAPSQVGRYIFHSEWKFIVADLNNIHQFHSNQCICEFYIDY